MGVGPATPANFRTQTPPNPHYLLGKVRKIGGGGMESRPEQIRGSVCPAEVEKGFSVCTYVGFDQVIKVKRPLPGREMWDFFCFFY